MVQLVTFAIAFSLPLSMWTDHAHAATIEKGDRIGSLYGIPKKPKLNIYQGTSANELDKKNAIGHVSWTPMPGRVGTVGMACHRVSHSAPCYYLNRLTKDKNVTISFKGITYTYVVVRQKTV